MKPANHACSLTSQDISYSRTGNRQLSVVSGLLLRHRCCQNHWKGIWIFFVNGIINREVIMHTVCRHIFRVSLWWDRIDSLMSSVMMPYDVKKTWSSLILVPATLPELILVFSQFRLIGTCNYIQNLIYSFDEMHLNMFFCFCSGINDAKCLTMSP